MASLTYWWEETEIPEVLYLSSCCLCTNSLLPAFRNPSAFILYHQSAKVTRCVFDVLTAYITGNNKLSGLRQHLIFNFCKTRKKNPPTFCYHSHYECHVSLKTVCLYIMSSLCQTSVNGSRPPHTIPHKKKLWNSLELSNTLIVENVTVAHGGEFICSASSGQMEKSASAFLTVYGGCSENKTPVMLAENFQKVPSQAIIQHSQKICM